MGGGGELAQDECVLLYLFFSCHSSFGSGDHAYALNAARGLVSALKACV